MQRSLNSLNVDIQHSSEYLLINNFQTESILGPSLLGKTWIFAKYDESLANAISQRLNESDIVSKLLAIRGLSPGEASTFLDPTLRNGLPDPSCLTDMDKAVDRVLKAIQRNEKILIWGDYDVDGATSVTILLKFFEFLNYPVSFYIPHRDKDGYGATEKSIKSVIEPDLNLMIFVDCGTMAHGGLEAVRANGTDAIVIDHHIIGETLPHACAIVNPQRDDNQSLKNLCAAGVVFLFTIALNRVLRVNGFYKDKPEPDLRMFLDLVALGTVCDVVPLTGLNRIFVSQGLKIIEKQFNVGIRALSSQARIKASNSDHLAFMLGPRINAAGRLGDATISVELLATTDTQKASQIAFQLDQLNKQRQKIEEGICSEAIAQAIQHEDDPFLLIIGDNWPTGILGIVAGRLKEKFDKPCCVASFKDNELGKGSGRSVPGFDLGDCIQKAVSENLLATGGGHSQAVGFTLLKDKIDEFRRFAINAIRNHKFEKPKIVIDSVMNLYAITDEFAKKIQKLAPFGMGNPSPVFMIPNVFIDSVIQSKSHIHCTLAQSGETTIKAVAFRKNSTNLGKKFLENDGTMFHVVGAIQYDQYTRGVKFLIEDAIDAN